MFSEKKIFFFQWKLCLYLKGSHWPVGGLLLLGGGVSKDHPLTLKEVIREVESKLAWD